MDAKSTGATCDRCGAAAKARYVRGADEWQWCGHHDREHGPALVLRGFEVYEVAVPVLPDLRPRAKPGSAVL